MMGIMELWAALRRVGLLATVAALGAGCSAQTPASSPTPTPTTARPTPTVDQWSLPQLVPGLQTPAPHFRAPAPKVATAGPAVTVDLRAPAASQMQWRSTNVGLSFEAEELDDPRWAPEGSPLTPLLTALHQPSLRFGGNSVDRRMWWTSSGEPAPKWAKATVTPTSFQRLRRMADRTNATVTLVLDLGHQDAKRAADMAFHARKALGPRLVAVTIGNEPNGYHHPSQPKLQLRKASWDERAYAAQARAYQKAIHTRAPGLPLAGPGAYDASWWRAFGDAKLPHTVALTQHWYPLWSCPTRSGATDPRATPTVANLTSPWLHAKASTMISTAQRTAASYRLPLWLEETGPTSCTGAAVSRTHAHALWSVDYVLNAAANGARRTNMHSTLLPCGRGNPMSTVCSTTGPQKADPVVGQSSFQSLLFAAQLRPGTVRPVMTGNARIFGHAITSRAGTDLVLVNMNDPAKVGASAVKVLPPKVAVVTQASLLTGDSLASRTGTTLLSLSPATSATSLDAGSALLVRLQPPRDGKPAPQA
ncbi:hypothetical protein EDD41_1271 [Luteococcus japonicus]|uniref:Glycosyl hydrolase family 79 n=2 Tax=Luteococcus japonicus TaxID=33984 RepID=A0A3N1ZT97_9ACTN|nr:hypothetical protein EDD41_1271 [Luteococcus japonicus]